MTFRRALAFATLGVILQLALGHGLLSGWPAGVRVTLAFVTLVMLPGLGWLAAIGVAPPGGAWLASGWALGLGVAWSGLLVLATRALHLPFTVLDGAGAGLGLLPWAAALALRPRGVGRDAPGLGRVPVALIAVAALLAALHVARAQGPPVTYYSDSPDHIGTIRRMMSEGDAFPTDAFFRDAGRAGADPRKGLWHPQVARVALLAGTDAESAWRTLAALLAPLFVLNAAAFAFLLGGGGAAAIGAWALLFTYGGSLAGQYLREAVFATKLADQIALATATAVLVDLEARTARSRTVAVALAVGAVAAHVFAALQFGVVFGALGVALLVRDRGASPMLRRLVVTASALALATLPYLLWRARLSYAPNNVIHTEAQGLLTLWGHTRVVSPGVLWDWTQSLWLLFPLSWLAWGRAAAKPAVLYLLASSLAVIVLLFCPPVVALLQPRIGYLTMRFVWLLPVSGAVAWAFVAASREAAAGRIGAAALGAGTALLLLAPSLADGARALVVGAPRTAPEKDVSGWAGPLRWIDAHLPPGTVVLSDPATSYTIPMATREFVVTLVDQHSSPNDSLALTRILESRDALDPWASWATTCAVVRARGVGAIVLNRRFAEPPRLDYWAPNSAWFVRARARFDAAPGAFPRLFDAGDFVVYGVRAESLDALPAAAPARAYVRDAGPVPAPAALAPGAEALPVLESARLSAPVARPGESLAMVLDWRAPRPLPAGSYSVAVRFDRVSPPPPEAPAWCEKPVRKLFEHLRHERYRFRWDHLPVFGDYGVDRWSPREVVRDSFVLAVPADAASGAWRVEVRMLRQPHYPNYHLSDYFLDRDYYSGAAVGTLSIARASAPREGSSGGGR